MRASIQFALNQILQAHVLQTSGDPASEVALRKFEKRACTPDAQVRLASLLVIFPLLGKPYGQRRALIVGHRPPFCSATRPISLTALDSASLHRYSAHSTSALASTSKKGERP